MHDSSLAPSPTLSAFFANPLAGWANDDLLLDERRRAEIKTQFPNAIRVLDWPELRDAFVGYDAHANLSRRTNRGHGVVAVSLGYTGLVLSAASVLIPDWGVLFTRWDVVVAVAGALLTVLGGWVGFQTFLIGRRKREWIVNRFWTERLRQFYFQFIINNLPAASGAMGSADAFKAFDEIRTMALSDFMVGTDRSFDRVLTAMLSDTGEADPWIERGWEREDAIEPDSLGAELIAALGETRLGVQERYTQRKLRQGYHSASWRLGVLRALGDLLTVTVLFITLAIGVVAGFSNTTSTPPLEILIFAGAVLSGGVVALKAIEEGQQLAADDERYSWYLASVRALKQRFNMATNGATRLHVLRELEHLSYQELRRFILAARASRFLM